MTCRSFPHTKLSGEAIEASGHQCAMVMERMEKATTTKTVPKITVVETSRPMEIEEEVKLWSLNSVTAPPFISSKYYERAMALGIPMETKAFGSMTSTRPVLSHSKRHDGKEPRPFTLKNLEALGIVSVQEKPDASTWLTEMSRWIRLSKVAESDLWDVVATCATGVALTWISE